MNLETERRILRKLKKLTSLELDICAQESELLHDLLSDNKIAGFFSNQSFRYNTFEDWRLAIQITDSFQNGLYDLVDNLTKILYAKKCLEEYCEVPA